MKKKYRQKHNEKTVDLCLVLWYYIAKERETENLRGPKPYRLTNDRIGDPRNSDGGKHRRCKFTDCDIDKQADHKRYDPRCHT